MKLKRFNLVAALLALFLIQPTRASAPYSLNTWYVYVANGDKVTVLWVDNN